MSHQRMPWTSYKVTVEHRDRASRASRTGRRPWFDGTNAITPVPKGGGGQTQYTPWFVDGRGSGSGSGLLARPGSGQEVAPARQSRGKAGSSADGEGTAGQRKTMSRGCTKPLLHRAQEELGWGRLGTKLSYITTRLDDLRLS